jgi:hypothetical protein
MKKVMPAIGTTTAFTVNRWRLRGVSVSAIVQLLDKAYILWIGNQIAGNEISQKRKKHIKSFVSVPDDAGRWFATVMCLLGGRDKGDK